MSTPRHYVIIIGAMKSGTTTLFDLLAQHPKIAPCIGKEPGFFAFDEIYEKGFDWFDSIFQFDPAQHRYRLEASTDYTKTPFVTGVWDRMTAEPGVSVKLLYIMRHPLQRIESHAKHTQNAKREIGQQISPRDDHGLDAGLSAVSLAVSSYASQLDTYQTALAAGQLHCLSLEDLKADPEPTLAAIWDFLELEPLDTKGGVKASNVATEKTRLHPAWKTITSNATLTAAAKSVVPAGMRETVKSKFNQKLKLEGRFKLTDAEIEALKTLYANEMARLRSEYEIDTKRLWGL